MRILIFHGYLLRGTGSNVYNAELARALRADGHEVHLLCQDRDPAALAFVDAVGDWDANGDLVVRETAAPPAPGSCTVYRPPIGRLLPVYVADRYEGFDARTFDLLSEDELDGYIDANVRAVRHVHERARIEGALANHLVMGPCILARALPAEVPLAVKIHGSALEYTVKPHPRFLPYADEGIERAATVLVGSEHTATRLLETVTVPDVEQRTFLGPPGVDVERFVPARDAANGLLRLHDSLIGADRAGFPATAHERVAALSLRLGEAAGATAEVAGEIAAMQSGYDTAGIDEAAPAAVRRLARQFPALAAERASSPPRLVLYVGKLIVSKGVDLLIAAWPLVRAEQPDARLMITGFGAYREGLGMLVAALDRGDLAAVRAIAEAGRELEGGDRAPLVHLLAFLDALGARARKRYLAAAAGMTQSIEWFGRLEHDLLADLTPAALAQVVPSTFPEAFGMVAAEAAACGVPPVCAHHSGLAEVTDALAAPLDDRDGALLSFERGDDAVTQLADRLVQLLALEPARRRRLAENLRAVASERFSWTGVARGVCDAASGRHERLMRP